MADVMDDKEVGRFWLHHISCDGGSHNGMIGMLIRKLVEVEKTNRPADPYWLILRQYGVPLETWK